MRPRALPLLLVLLALAAPSAAQEGSAVIRVYTLKHISVVDLYPYLQPLLSPGGDLRVSSQTQFQVKDIPERQRLVEKMVASLDQPPATYRIAIKVLEASQAPPAANLQAEIAGIGAQLKGLMPYASYAVLEQLVVEGMPGNEISYRLGKDYHLEFHLRRDLRHPQMIQLSSLRLFRVKPAGNGQEQLVPVMRTTINLTVAQTHVLGVSTAQGGAKALVMVFQAERQ
jgi:hypothetical protein